MGGPRTANKGSTHLAQSLEIRPADEGTDRHNRDMIFSPARGDRIDAFVISAVIRGRSARRPASPLIRHRRRFPRPEYSTHLRLRRAGPEVARKTWLAGTSPAMTKSECSQKGRESAGRIFRMPLTTGFACCEAADVPPLPVAPCRAGSGACRVGGAAPARRGRPRPPQ